MLAFYKETAVDPRAGPPPSTTLVQIPSHDGSYKRSKHFHPTSSQPPLKDEATFSDRLLATQSSIYFRHSKSYPRTFLWRVLEDNRVLEVRCADLARSGHEQNEAGHILRFEFQHAILPAGVVFADTEDHDILHTFVVTAGKSPAKAELYTLSLNPEFFRRQITRTENVREWCKSCVPASFHIARPHRLHASTPFELFLSLDNGALLRLVRKAGHDGSSWTPTSYDDRPWGSSIRGYVKWQTPSAVEYEARSLDILTANAIATTSDSTYVFTVCLNHTLRAWNLATGKLAFTRDLLNKQRPQQDLPSVRLNPAETSFIRIYKPPTADIKRTCYLVTFSPHGEGQFKFWSIGGGLTEPLTITDEFPDTKLMPPDPDPSGANIWTMAGFEVVSVDAGRATEIWVLWRNHTAYQLYSLHFNFSNIEESWDKDWVMTTAETWREADLPIMVASDVADPSEKWLEFLFSPSRFNEAVLETSLSIYKKALRLDSTPVKNESMQERLCSTVGATVSLRKYADGNMDYDRFLTDTDAQWRQFWRIAENLNQRRREPLSLAYDTFTSMSWVAMTDTCAAVRECSDLEILHHNETKSLVENGTSAMSRWTHRRMADELRERVEQASLLMSCASDFRAKFSPELRQICETALKAELFSEPELSADDRINHFYSTCNFERLVSDDAVDQVADQLEALGNIHRMDSAIFHAIIDSFLPGLNRNESLLKSTSFGRAVTVRGAREMIHMGRQILFDLLMLVVFVEMEFNQDEAFSKSFDAQLLFSILIDELKQCDMMLWLASNMRDPPGSPADIAGKESISDLSSNKAFPAGEASTVLENLFAKDIRPQPTVEWPESYLLTQGIRDVISWMNGADEVPTENSLVYIQCNLLANGNVDLASAFARFQPATAWSTYVKGRLCLATSKYDCAAIYFQKAAYKLSCGQAFGELHEMSSGLLSVLEIDNFFNGLPKYYQHVLSLFEADRCFSYAADFARLAVEALPHSSHESDVALNSELLSRLFSSELQTGRFDSAYSALSQYTDKALQKSGITSLVTAIFTSPSAAGDASGRMQQLLKLPLGWNPQLSQDVDVSLAGLARQSHSSWSDRKQYDYLKILQAYRLARNDFRGAVSVLFKRLTLLKQSSVADSDPEAKELRHSLLSLINLLSSVDADDAYILAEVPEDGSDMTNGFHEETDDLTGWKRRKRIIVTLDDLRKEYQGLLDKCSRYERGDFAFELEIGTEDDDDDEVMEEVVPHVNGSGIAVG